MSLPSHAALPPGLVHHSERHGFTIYRNFCNNVGRLCSTQQSWHVTHPTHADKTCLPLGYSSILAAAVGRIDETFRQAHEMEPEALAEAFLIRRLYTLRAFYPNAPNVAAAIAIEEKRAAEQAAQLDAEAGARQRLARVRDAAEPMLAALILARNALPLGPTSKKQEAAYAAIVAAIDLATA